MHEYIGATKPTSLEQANFEPDLSAGRVTEIPSNMQMRVQYSDVKPIYVGYAPRGLLSSQDGWLLHKYSYVDINMVQRQVAYDSWDNRATTAVYG